MQYVYVITHAFLSLVQRQDVFPESLNTSMLLDTPTQELPRVLEEHWVEILLQYIGVVTVTVCDLLFALAIPHRLLLHVLLPLRRKVRRRRAL